MSVGDMDNRLICPECGMPLTAGVSICPECGYPVGAVFKDTLNKSNSSHSNERSNAAESGTVNVNQCAQGSVGYDTLRERSEHEEVPEDNLTMAVCALVLAFLVPPAGLIIGIIGLRKSKGGQVKNLCRTAVIIASVMTAALIVLGMILVPKLLSYYNTARTISDTVDGVLDILFS